MGHLALVLRRNMTTNITILSQFSHLKFDMGGGGGCTMIIQLNWIDTLKQDLWSRCKGLLSWWTWWRHQMETFSVLLAICAGNSPVTGEFPAQRPVTRSFDVFFDLRPNKRLSKQSRSWWFETPSRSLWRHSNDNFLRIINKIWSAYVAHLTPEGDAIQTL